MTQLSPAAIAFDLAKVIHGTDVKHGGMPEIAHVTQVAGLVMEYGGDENQVAAAFLHDTVEGGCGQPLLDKIAQVLSDDVANMVSESSDWIGTDLSERLPWLPRKSAFIDELSKKSDRSLLIIACDKKNNMERLIDMYGVRGEAVWSEFNPNATPDQILWYYQAITNPLVPRLRTMGALPRELADNLLWTLEPLQRMTIRRAADVPAFTI